jgi:type I restriction enzyme R subunit
MSGTLNQTPEQKARDAIDAKLKAAGWCVQDHKKVDFNAGRGIALREYPSDTGPVDYVIFVDRKPVGVIEAKPDDWGHKITTVEEQSNRYANAKLKHINNDEPLRFVYESTGVITRFTDQKDPKPRSREVFSFHRPETLAEWLEQAKTLRGRFDGIPPLLQEGLRDCQINAIENLEQSFRDNKPRALVQMATGSGKTYTAITSVYRLLKYADAKRILFLVDTKNLGEQAEQEFMSYIPNDDNRKFIELYTVQRLKSSSVASDSQVCISTIQRMYSILKGEELDESLEELNPAEQITKPKEPLPVVYNEKIPPEFFDIIIIDECHRSIYNLWRQVIEYFDAFLIGLTATPDNRTYGFFNKNIVSEYDHDKAVADGVNVGYEVFAIETEITKAGAKLTAKQQIERREKLTRKRRWDVQDEDEEYSSKQLDKDIVNPSQIRTVIESFKNSLPTIFPGRNEVPKTLIFAKTDSHADDIIQIVREEFNESNQFCKKVTHKAFKDTYSEEGELIQKAADPKDVLNDFRNDYYPRIAVTVDMIATGTDVRPLECLLFMRDVKSRNYFEQMKGRGTRVLDEDGLKKVTPSAMSAKTHFVIVDAIGVTKSLKTNSQPLITKPTVSLGDLARGVMMGTSDEETVSSLIGRLSRLVKQLEESEKQRIKKQAGGVELQTMIGDLARAIDPDAIEAKAKEIAGVPENSEPGEDARNKARAELVTEAAKPLTGEVIELIETIKRDREQKIDHINIDEVTRAEWDGDSKENAEALVKDFESYLAEHRDEIEALSIYFNQPARRSEVTYSMIKALFEQLKTDQPKLSPTRVWSAYALLDDYKGENPVSQLTALVGLIRRVSYLDNSLTPYASTVRKNFQTWIMQRHSGAGEKFNEEQMAWLHMIRDHMISSFHMEREDFEMPPFDSKGGLGKMYDLFGECMDSLIEEMNRELVA